MKSKVNKKELEAQVEASIKAKKEKKLAEWKELQEDKNKLDTERDKILAELDKKYPFGSKNHSDKYKDSEFEVIRLIDIRLGWLNEVQKEMLYENYFLKHSKGRVVSKTRDDEFWDDKYYYDIRDILGKCYRKCMSGVNDFYLVYEGASDNDIDPDYNMGGISTSTWGFIGNFVYKIIREISEPQLYFHSESDGAYHGVLYRNLYEWRNKKGFVKSVNGVKVEPTSKENNPDYQAGFKAGVKSGSNVVLNQVPESVFDERENKGYMKTIDQELGNDKK